MSPEASAQAIEHDPYASVRREQEADADRLRAQETVQWFYSHLKRCVLRSALCRWKSPADIVREFRQNAHTCTNFEFKFEGEDILKNCDFVLANHQGPKEDGQRCRDDGEVRGAGGIECLIAIDAYPEHARIVLRRNLVSLQLKELLQSPSIALPCIVKALAFRRNNPITVDRSLIEPSYDAFAQLEAKKLREERKLHSSSVDQEETVIRRSVAFENYVAGLRAERRRVGNACCESVNDGTPIVVYPEGTRSEDGRILGFVSEYFESIVEKYLLPRLEDPDRPIKIGLLVADTLRTFPYGVGKNVKAYDHPITMKGVSYDPKNIVEALRKTISQKSRQKDEKGTIILEDEEIQKLGRMMLIEVRAQMERTLVEIVNATND